MKLYYNNSSISGKSTSYLDFLSKPKVNNIPLLANSTAEDVLITKFLSQEEYDSLGSKNPYTLYIINDGRIGSFAGYLNYNNKPKLNNQILDKNKTSRDINMYNIEAVDIMFANSREVWVATTKPTDPAPDALYYVGPDSEGFYHKWLYDDNCNEIDLGSTNESKYLSTDGIILNDSEGTISVDYSNNFICDAFGTLSAIIFNDSEDGIVLKPSAGEQDKLLTSDIVYEDIDTFVGATTSADGKKGLVPKPLSTDKDKFFCANGNYEEVSAEDFKGATHTAKGKQGYVIKPLTNQHGTWLKGSCIWENPQFLIDMLYPVGTVYASTKDTYPGQGVDGVVASWDRLPDGYILWSASSNLRDTIDAGIPVFTLNAVEDHTHTGLNYKVIGNFWPSGSGAGYVADMGSSLDSAAGSHTHTIVPDSIYGQSTTVQPPAIKTCFYRRVS